MAGNVPLGATAVVTLMVITDEGPEFFEIADPTRRVPAHQIAGADIQKIIEVTAHYIDAAIHEKLAKRQRGVGHQPPFGAAIVDLDGNFGANSVAEMALDTIRSFDFDIPETHEFRDKIRKQRTHSRLPAQLRCEDRRRKFDLLMESL